MKKALKIIGIILIVILIGAAVAWFGFLRPDPPLISVEDRQSVELMPLPSELKLKDGKVYLNSGLTTEWKGVNSERLDRAIKRFEQRMQEALRISTNTGNKSYGEGPEETILLRIQCDSISHDYPTLEEDESYSLKIRGGRIELFASEERGVLHGLETLYQLLKTDDEGLYVPELELADAPRYPWRGLMIDVSRHWIPKEVILRNLDGMASVKMNVLHLHLTDHQGFRIESKVFPKLHEMGSEGENFKQEDIMEILDYAADRGIRIVPEFDVPGHTASWFPGYPELASNVGPHELYKGVTGNAIMNPAKEETFEFLSAFFQEMASLFPDQYLHVGADEARAEDWDLNPEILAFKNANGLSDNHEVYAYFSKRLYEIVKSSGKRMLGWDEIQEAGLPADDIGIQSWRNHKSLWDAARDGSLALLSAGYYLDHKQSAAFHYEVDPGVIKGAVNIEIDSTNWESWQCMLRFNDAEIEGELYLFGEGEGRRGVMGVMGNLHDFEEVEDNEGLLTYDIVGPMGKATFEVRIEGDSLRGKSNISVFTLDITGARSGGSDMPEGAPLPEFEKIEPLKEDQLKNIVGGEACMWTETADSITLESRIWPRTGAVAEKLWSPKELTDDPSDMYRRLFRLDDRLEQLGLKHRTYREDLIISRLEPVYKEPMRELISVLQEDLLFNRMLIYDPPFGMETPLDRVVDAAAPESYDAVRFERKVTAWSESKDNDLKEEILEQLEVWKSLNEKLQPVFEQDLHFEEVKPHVIHLSYLAEYALIALDEGTGASELPRAELDVLLLESRKAHGGTLLSVVSGLQTLIRSPDNQEAT